MIVTPKEIDDLIENMKNVIARRNKFCTIKLSIFHKLKVNELGKINIINT